MAGLPVRFLRHASSFSRINYNLRGWNKYGLLQEDLLYEDEEVKEALRRLPQEVKDERNFRMITAIHHSMCHKYLPKEKWTKMEEDISYLKPYLDEVRKENLEKAEWDKKP
uniref:Cytochrome b-c1 complex subunit 7 n=1 Tax=Scolopendra viridis TaxID=118503 RepID=A0A4D5RA02_SCOVI